MSAPFATTSAGVSAGKSYLILGASLGTPGLWDVAMSDTIFEGATSGESAGKSISKVGDIDGDGLDDILIGAPHYAVTKGDIFGSGEQPRLSGPFVLTDADYIFEEQSQHVFRRTIGCGRHQWRWST